MKGGIPASGGNSGDLWQVSVATSPEAEEAVCEMLERVLGCPAVSYHDLETGAFVVSAFLPAKGRWRAEIQTGIVEGLREIVRSGLDPAPGIVTHCKLRKKSWAESWKKHFRPLEISSKLLLLPSWIRRKPRPGQKVIVLDPGLSFGTGHHATTEFCLREITHGMTTARGDSAGQPLSLLDVGSGSGILAIAAAKIGYQPVHAVEIDPEAVRISRANARRNRVLHQIQFAEHDLAKLKAGARYTVVCANLVANLLIAERRRLYRLLAPAGKLVLAGILATEFEGVRRRFEELGLVLIRARTRKEWRSGTFVHSNNENQKTAGKGR